MIISESVVKKWCTPLIVVPSSFVWTYLQRKDCNIFLQH